MSNTRDFLKKYYDWDESEWDVQEAFVHASMSDLEALLSEFGQAVVKEALWDLVSYIRSTELPAKNADDYIDDYLSSKYK